MTNYPMGWRVGRICVAALIAVMGLAAPARVDAQVTAYAYVLLPGTPATHRDRHAHEHCRRDPDRGRRAFVQRRAHAGRSAGLRGRLRRTIPSGCWTQRPTRSSARRSPSPTIRTAWGSARTERRLYVGNSGNSSVSVINTATNTVLATVPVGSLAGHALRVPEWTARLHPELRQQHAFHLRHGDQHDHRRRRSPCGCTNPVYATFTPRRSTRVRQLLHLGQSQSDRRRHGDRRRYRDRPEWRARQRHDAGRFQAAGRESRRGHQPVRRQRGDQHASCPP